MDDAAAGARAAPIHDAFISYSRKDAVFARRLEKALEEFKPPRDLPVEHRSLDVFLDEGDLVGPDYFRAVHRHLEQSRKLIVVCSPAARASPFVNDEIERFLRSHSGDDVISVLLSGLANNEATSEADPQCAFPPALLKALEMPLAADYRGIDAQRQRVDRDPYASAWFSVLANLYGQRRALIEQREIRRQARNRRIRAGVVGSVMAALAVALAVSLVYREQAVKEREVAVSQRNRAEQSALEERAAKKRETMALRTQERLRGEAEESRDEALRQRNIAESEAIAARRETAERLAVQAIEKLSGAPEEAVGLALSSVKTFRLKNDPLVPRSLGALLRVGLAFGGGVPALPQADPRLSLLVSDDLRWAAQTDPDGNVRLGAMGSSTPKALLPPPLAPGRAWSKGDARLAFGPRHLIAMRQSEAIGGGGRDDRALIYAWPLDPDSSAAPSAPARLLDSSDLGGWTGSTRLLTSPDGRWLAWSDGYKQAFLRALDASTSLKMDCAFSRACLMAFSPDSSMFVLHTGPQGIRHFQLPQAGSTPIEGVPITSSPQIPVRMAVFAGERPVANTLPGSWRHTVRLAILDVHGGARWWNLSSTEPELHELPNLLLPFASKLTLSDLNFDHIQANLSWHAAGHALMASVVHEGKDFGVAAINLVEQEGPWQPLWHRYDGKAQATTSQFVGKGIGGLRGYRVKDSSDLGVQSSVWVDLDGAVTLGFDGSVWFRHLERLSSGRFQLVERDASAALQWSRFLIIGKRDGRLHFWDLEHEADRPWLVLNGHDSEVREIRVRGSPHRLLSVDARGVARVWDMSHPSMVGRLRLTHSDSVIGRNQHWLVTCCSKGMQLWPRPGLAVPPLLAPVRLSGTQDAGRANAVANSSWAVSMRVDAATSADAGSETPLHLRFWPLHGAVPPNKPTYLRRYAIAAAGRAQHWWLRAPQGMPSALPARVLVGNDASSGQSAWILPIADAGAKPLRIGRSEEIIQSNGSSDDLRWILVKKSGAVGGPMSHGIVDVERPPQTGQNHLDVWPMPAGYDGGTARFSPDGRWMLLQMADYNDCLLRLSVPLPACIPIPRDAKKNRMGVLFARGRMPLAWSPGSEIRVLTDSTPPRFVAVESLPAGLAVLAWSNDGRWLSTWSKKSGVVLRSGLDAGTLAGSKSTRLPDPPADAPAIERLFPFPDQGWVLAAVERGGLLAWHRDAAGHWQSPFHLTADTLRLDQGPTRVQLWGDGRELMLDDEHLSLDPARLAKDAAQLLSGRSP
jgi:hypothetical protein